MKQKDLQQIIILMTALLVTIVCYKTSKPKSLAIAPPPVIENIPVNPPPPPKPAPQISVATPDYLDYQGIVNQLKKWNQEAPGLTSVGTYGKSKRGTDIYYLKISSKPDQPRVLITACIHGNEPWSTGVVMAYLGNLLSQYGKDNQITELLDTREIYFVPVVSPDSYPRSRHVDGVDPNRDFPTEKNPNKRSSPSVAALQAFFLQIKPNAVISGHTWGRILLHPYGDKYQPTPHESEIKRIVGQMAAMCEYRYQPASKMYSTPIFGTEVDWYYRNGSFAIVMEFGTHQRIPSREDIRTEFDRTFKGVLFYIREAPLVKIRQTYWLEAA